MNETKAKEMLDKIVAQVFGYKNPFSLEQFMKKYAFDVRLPQQANDATTGEETWVQSTNPVKFITIDNTIKRKGVDDWIVPTRPLKDIREVLKAWDDINFTASDRHVDSLNVAESDSIYSSENIFRSQDIRRSKNVMFSDGADKCEYVIASQRSNNSTYCIRLEDSMDCSESFSVSWSGKISKSFFIHDAYDLFECIFCSHITSKRYCIANMQFEEAEYHRIKKMIVEWILTAS